MQQVRTRDELAKVQKEKAKNRPQAPASNNLKVMVRDAVHVEALTGDPHWDRFLSFVQAGANQTQEAIDHTKRILEDPRIVNHDAILATKLELAKFLAMKETIEWLLELPKVIMTQGSKARELIPKPLIHSEDNS